MLSPEIIYEDEELLALNKPAGWLIHNAANNSAGPVLADWLLERWPALAGVGEPQPLDNGSLAARPGLVHRLDRDTSGVLVVAGTPRAFSSLKTQFQSGQIKKEYRALVYGCPKQDQGTIDLPIGRRRDDPRRRQAGPTATGKLRSALTAYRVLARGNDYSYLALFPKTGRTHQLRVHLLALGYPVVADALYAPGRRHLLPINRQALHAFSLELTQPAGGQLKLVADLPADFKAALAQAVPVC